MRLALLGVLFASASIIACSVEKAPEGSSEDPTIARDSQDVVPLQLACGAAPTSFDLAPAGGKLAGTLAIEGGSTTFLCTEPAPDPSGSVGLAVTCAEQAQTLHPGTWKVDVSKDGPVFRATIIKGDGADTVVFCKAPVRPGEKVASLEDAKPIIQATCHGCHRNGTFGTIEKIKAKRSLMIERLANREMPKNDAEWLDTADAKTLLDFLLRSPELD